MAMKNFFVTKVISKEIIAKDVIEFRVTKPAGFVFTSGQFVQWQIPSSDGLVLRSYSISSVPEDPYLEFCIKLVPNGKASNFANNLERGGELIINEARGVFVCSKESRTQKVFIATGSGLAPIVSMLGSVLNKRDSEKATLIFGVRYEEDIFWKNRLDNWKLQLSHFNYLLTISRPTQSWKGLVGRVTSHLQGLELTSLALTTEFYICGNMEMVKDVRALLIKNNVNAKSIHFEIF